MPGIGAAGQLPQTQLGRNLPAGTVTGKQMVAGAGFAALTAAAVKLPQMFNELDEIKQNEDLTNKERGRARGGAVGDATGSIAGAAVGGAAGIAAGAAVGAAVGSVVPVLGTAVGALVGAGVGALGMYLGGRAGRAIGENIGEGLARDDQLQQMAIEDLPPQITQTTANIPQPKLDLGHADINLNLTLDDNRVHLSTSVSNNTMPARFPPTGNRNLQRGAGL
jgi:phage tail tape-measure protein